MAKTPLSHWQPSLGQSGIIDVYRLLYGCHSLLPFECPIYELHEACSITIESGPCHSLGFEVDGSSPHQSPPDPPKYGQVGAGVTTETVENINLPWPSRTVIYMRPTNIAKSLDISYCTILYQYHQCISLLNIVPFEVDIHWGNPSFLVPPMCILKDWNHNFWCQHEDTHIWKYMNCPCWLGKSPLLDVSILISHGLCLRISTTPPPYCWVHRLHR